MDIMGPENIRLLFWKNIIICLSEPLFERYAEHLTDSIAKKYKPVLLILDINRISYTVDNCFKILRGYYESLRCVFFAVILCMAYDSSIGTLILFSANALNTLRSIVYGAHGSNLYFI
jgi:hypothetical protein